MITSLSKIKQDLIKNNSDAILISSIPNIIYLTGYSGFSKDEREAYLVITKNEQYILTDGRYSHAAKTLISDFKLIEICSENSLSKILQNLKLKHKIKNLGIEDDNIKVSEHKVLKKYFGDTYHYGGTNNLRIIKNKDEILKIEKSCKLGDKTFDYILRNIKLGITEKELAFKIEFFIKKNGGDISFPPIVAYGANSANPHHLPTAKQLIKNSIILLDFGAKLDNYCSDMSRTIFFGKPTTEQKSIYKTVLCAQQKAIDSLAMDIKASEIDKIARDYITSQGYKTIPHSLGHGVGIEVHESPHLSPKSKDMLKEGMVFSVEPGIYIPNLGGVRIEDLVVLTKNGPRLLTHSPKNLIEL